MFSFLFPYFLPSSFPLHTHTHPPVHRGKAGFSKRKRFHPLFLLIRQRRQKRSLPIISLVESGRGSPPSIGNGSNRRASCCSFRSSLLSFSLFSFSGAEEGIFFIFWFCPFVSLQNSFPLFFLFGFSNVFFNPSSFFPFHPHPFPKHSRGGGGGGGGLGYSNPGFGGAAPPPSDGGFKREYEGSGGYGGRDEKRPRY